MIARVDSSSKQAAQSPPKIHQGQPGGKEGDTKHDAEITGKLCRSQLKRRSALKTEILRKADFARSFHACYLLLHAAAAAKSRE